MQGTPLSPCASSTVSTHVTMTDCGDRMGSWLHSIAKIEWGSNRGCRVRLRIRHWLRLTACRRAPAPKRAKLQVRLKAAATAAERRTGLHHSTGRLEITAGTSHPLRIYLPHKDALTECSPPKTVTAARHESKKKHQLVEPLRLRLNSALLSS